MPEYEEGTETVDADGADTTADEEPNKPAKPTTVPYVTFEKKAAESRGHKQESARLAATVTDLTAQLDALKSTAAELPTLQARLATTLDELDLSRAGLNDPKAIKVARMEYDEIPAADRPATLGAYYAGLKEIAATDPTKVPKALTPWIVAPAAEPAKREKAPPDTGTDGKLPPSGSVISPGAIRDARQRWQRTGSDADRAALEQLVSAAEKKKA